jgi:hypothetical protein
MPIAECGLKKKNEKIRIPKSAIHNPQSGMDPFLAGKS